MSEGSSPPTPPSPLSQTGRFDPIYVPTTTRRTLLRIFGLETHATLLTKPLQRSCKCSFSGGVGLHNPGIWLFVSLWPRFYVFWGHFSGAPALELVRKYENQELNSKERLERVYCCKEVVVIKKGWMISNDTERSRRINFSSRMVVRKVQWVFYIYMYERI